MSLTPAEVNYVEHIVQEKLRYEAIFEEQSKVFQADEAKFKQVIMQFQQSSFVAKPDQKWLPTPDKVDEYLAQCDNICRTVPRNDDELSVMRLF